MDDNLKVVGLHHRDDQFHVLDFDEPFEIAPPPTLERLKEIEAKLKWKMSPWNFKARIWRFLLKWWPHV